MPLPVDSLTPDSDVGSIQDAIGKSIQACMNEPVPEGTNVDISKKQRWCAGKAYGIARQRTGKPLGGVQGNNNPPEVSNV